ncbi:MAG: toxin [Cryobacterium sp.]|nr:toxin [Cryobacterium sp.]
MKVHDAALKHGVLPEDAIQAAAWSLWIDELDDDSPARQLRLGFDTQGRLLETVVLVFDSGNELVIHAMKARSQLLDLLDTEG